MTFEPGDMVTTSWETGFGIYMGASWNGHGRLHEFVWFDGTDPPHSLSFNDCALLATSMSRA